jgi:hypothetical protein
MAANDVTSQAKRGFLAWPMSSQSFSCVYDFAKK